jgi:hypothetical protein
MIRIPSNAGDSYGYCCYNGLAMITSSNLNPLFGSYSGSCRKGLIRIPTGFLRKTKHMYLGSLWKMFIRLNFEVSHYFLLSPSSWHSPFLSIYRYLPYLSGEDYMFHGYSGQLTQNIVGDQAVQRPARGEACRLRLLLYLRRLPGRHAVTGSMIRSSARNLEYGLRKACVLVLFLIRIHPRLFYRCKLE